LTKNRNLYFKMIDKITFHSLKWFQNHISYLLNDFKIICKIFQYDCKITFKTTNEDLKDNVKISFRTAHTSFNDLVQDLKPVSKILFNTLFRTSKARLRSLSQDLKPISKISLRTSKQGQDLKSVLRISFKTSITFKDLVATSKTRSRSLSQDLKPEILFRMSKTSSAPFKTSNQFQRSCLGPQKQRSRILIQDLKPVSKISFRISETKVKISHSRPQTSFKDLV
jgi:hypothetical protein